MAPKVCKSQRRYDFATTSIPLCMPAIAIPVFRYKNHEAIERALELHPALGRHRCSLARRLKATGTGDQRQPNGERLGRRGVPGGDQRGVAGEARGGSAARGLLPYLSIHVSRQAVIRS